jgi:uroporphyrinogen-III synthase
MIGKTLAMIQLYKAYGAIFVTSSAGLIAFFSAGNITNSLPVAIVCQSFATMAGAWLISRPKLASVRSTHELNLLQELQRERAESTKFMIERLRQQNRLIAALTITKHALTSELQSLTFQADILMDTLIARNIPHSKLKIRDFTEMTAEEDKIRGEIVSE